MLTHSNDLFTIFDIHKWSSKQFDIKCKTFADDTSIFSIANKFNDSTEEINKDLKRISERTYEWNRMLNPDVLLQNKLKKLVFIGKQ